MLFAALIVLHPLCDGFDRSGLFLEILCFTSIVLPTSPLTLVGDIVGFKNLPSV